MIKLSELLAPQPSELWTLVKQCGVDDVVALLDGGEQEARWLRSGDVEQPVAVETEAAPWSEDGLRAVVSRFAEHGLRVVAFEDTPPMDALRMGLPEGAEALAQLHEQIRAMGRLGIGVLCYNWMTFGSWARTAPAIVTRGGALTTGFSLADALAMPRHPRADEVTHTQLWDALDQFLDVTLPVAEEAGVKLALHPDDPPLPELRGVPRIANSLDAYRRIQRDHPSPSNCITFCQGNFALMTDDLPAAIEEFLPKIAFVHFRDVAGTVEDFVETFHDAGPTDLARCMRLYVEAGFDGPMRPDHVPTLAGESNDRPGYATLGRLFALGYIRGLQHATLNSAADR
ncbi:mannonate dehydratase [Nonomuraea sp. NPDC000554]|uniref:mannonate dehydratase n=1 Tax=Nonomuraea sp. NPDC000554 TaxID=3154259 RepID=UPI00332A254C